MADQPTSQGTKVGRTKVKQQGQTMGRYGSDLTAKAPASNTPTDVRP
jgi:hypothetical protein